MLAHSCATWPATVPRGTGIAKREGVGRLAHAARGKQLDEKTRTPSSAALRPGMDYFPGPTNQECMMWRQIRALVRRIYFSPRGNALGVRLYAAIRPPPYRLPAMEFQPGVWTGISSFHSVDGRQIGENNTSPEMYREVLSTEHRICRFEGTRNGLYPSTSRRFAT